MSGTVAGCWICGSTQASQYKAGNGPERLRPEDLAITDDRYGVTLELSKCGSCGFIHADASEVGDLTALYAQLDDQNYEDGEAARARQMRWLLEMAQAAHPRAKTLLDIGAAAGLLVHEAKAFGLSAVGVEPSHNLVEGAKRTRDVDLLQGIYPHPEIEGETFDIVTLVDVIEHVSDPVGLLEACALGLAPGGRCVVVTPDIASPTARMMGHRWWHLRLAHVGYFSSKTFSQAARKAGLKVLTEKRARWFFPIGYLAERTERYLPVKWWNKFASKAPGLRWLYGKEIPLNLFDSTVFILEKAPS